MPWNSGFNSQTSKASKQDDQAKMAGATECQEIVKVRAPRPFGPVWCHEDHRTTLHYPVKPASKKLDQFLKQHVSLEWPPQSSSIHKEEVLLSNG